MCGRLGLLAVAVVVGACASPSSSPSPNASGSDSPVPPLDDVRLVLNEAQSAANRWFATSDNCATCHQNADTAQAMRDERGQGIAPYDLWQASMMANAARDPLFRAVLSAEVVATPSLKVDIEKKCLGCHAPMAVRSTENFALESLYSDSENSRLGIDGVSCTVCHQIGPQGLGEAETFSGKFRINERREIYGPHADPFSMPMVHHSGYAPVQADHIVDSSLCGTCHTLFTDAVDASGRSLGKRLAEQTPFLEWQNSDFAANDRSCQSCHLPTHSEAGVPVATAIARNPMGWDFGRVDDRSPYGRHTLVGGNTLIPSILRDHPEELRPKASKEAFDRTIALARAQLKSSARLGAKLRRDGSEIQLDVSIQNLSGHKLPTAHPIRRMWLWVEIRGRGGTVRFRSGGYDDMNRLVSMTGLPLPEELVGAPILPHLSEIGPADGPVVYEAVMSDADDRPTFTLLRGTHFLKDNRILPLGWDPEGPSAEHTRPVGTAGDEDFLPGGDGVQYKIPLPDSDGPYEAHVKLLYLSLSPRWYAELERFDTPEVHVFRRYYEGASKAPETIASVTVTEAR